MTLDKTIEQLEKLQEMILESSEWVFGDEKTDYQYVKALRTAIEVLNPELVDDIKRIIRKYIDHVDMDLLNPDQYEEDDLEWTKDDQKYALRILKKLDKLA